MTSGAKGLFSDIFRQNILNRSRTSTGTPDTSVSKQKKSLLLTGENLRKQVEENTAEVINLVWKNRNLDEITPDSIRDLSELCYDCINHNLQDADTYKSDRELLEGRSGLSLDGRYRVWNVPYTDVSPVLIEDHMKVFYDSLLSLIKGVKDGFRDQAFLLAYADYTLDKVIHPWRDGCGRHATAVIMWLSTLDSSFGLPIFVNRDEHYEAIQSFDTHVEYMRLCLARSSG